MTDPNDESLEFQDLDEATPLGLDESPIGQFRALTQWHLSFARENPRSFNELNNLISSLGVKRDTSQINSRMFRFAQEALSKSQKLLLLDQLRTLAYMPEFSPRGELVSQTSQNTKSSPSLEEQWEQGIQNQKDSLLKDGKLYDLFRHSISTIANERNQKILLMRLGLEPFQVHTLQEVGDATGITRERVRQLVKKELLKLEKSCLWDDVFREEIERQFQIWGPLIPTTDLHRLSTWFDGFKLSPKSWEVFIEFFAPQISVLRTSDEAWLAPKAYGTNINRICEEYRDRKSDGATIANLSTFISNVDDIPICKPKFFEEQIANLAPTSRPSDTSLLKTFLEITETTFNIDDFFHFCMRNDHVIAKNKSRSIANRFADFAAPVSRRPTRYISRTALMKFNPKSEQYTDRFLEYWYLNFDEDRIFHGDEVRDWAVSQNLDFHNDWNSWWAVAPLKLDVENRFQINKLVLGMTKCWSEGEVPTKKQLIEEVLRKRGAPMKAREILAAIYPKMGVGDIHQIHDDGKIRALGNNFFEYRGD